MLSADLLIHNIGQLVTCASPEGPKRRDSMRDVGIVENRAIAVIDGKFAAVGTEEVVLAEYSSKHHLNAEGSFTRATG